MQFYKDVVDNSGTREKKRIVRVRFSDIPTDEIYEASKVLKIVFSTKSFLQYRWSITQ